MFLVFKYIEMKISYVAVQYKFTKQFASSCRSKTHRNVVKHLTDDFYAQDSVHNKLKERVGAKHRNVHRF